MSHRHWSGSLLPDSGDDILGSLTTLMDTVGVVVPAASIATARTILDTALAAEAPISPDRPTYFDIGGIIYRATGEQSNSRYTLSPVNEVESTFDTFIPTAPFSRYGGNQSALVTSRLPARPYDRVVLAFGMADAQVNGIAGLRVLIADNSGPATSRWENNSSLTTQTSFNMKLVPAGVDPKTILAVSFGGASSQVSTVTFSQAADVNKLMVLAFPVTMS
ncbi:hypothetical protein [Actinobaculum sp. 352]|uniref:hypothetical protein n=1 Tax=Actinobaculum sp. 352 TaxID=2490946 RepID=UPI000F7F76C6|nr:hypothetical protein [Actinobaculum sp. 352]RTE47725.1 hypothetical protein EKN07_12105 [Actinobaculum sp. 352]